MFDAEHVPKQIQHCTSTPTPPALDLHSGLHQDVIAALAFNPAPVQAPPPSTIQPNIPHPVCTLIQLYAEKAAKGKAAGATGVAAEIVAEATAWVMAMATARANGTAISGNACTSSGAIAAGDGTVAAATTGPASDKDFHAAKLVQKKDCAPPSITLTGKKAAGGDVSAMASHKQVRFCACTASLSVCRFATTHL